MNTNKQRSTMIIVKNIFIFLNHCADTFCDKFIYFNCIHIYLVYVYISQVCPAVAWIKPNKINVMFLVTCRKKIRVGRSEIINALDV